MFAYKMNVIFTGIHFNLMSHEFFLFLFFFVLFEVLSVCVCLRECVCELQMHHIKKVIVV